MAGKALEVSIEVAKEIAKRLQLIYYSEDTYTNTCFLNSDEVRPEFKVSFNTLDLSDYINAMGCNAGYLESVAHTPDDSISIPYPSDLVEFWKFVEAGRLLRYNAI